MQQFIQRYQANVTHVLSGFDRLRFRGTLRLIANARGLMSLMAHLGIRVKEFKAFALKASAQVRATAEQVAATAERPIIYLPSYTIDKEATARRVLARDGIERGLIAVVACVERCASFDLRSDKAKGLLLVEPAPRKCQHYYFYYLHERFGFMHVRLQSWLPMTLWVCLNGREWLARDLTRRGLPYIRQDNCIRPLGAVARAQAQLDAQVRWNWARELQQLASQVNPSHATLCPDFPLHYYWSLEESEWASDVLFRSAADLQTLYPRFIRHGVEALACTDVMRYLGKHVNQDGTVPQRFTGAVVTDVRPAKPPRSRPPHPARRRGAESVRLKHRVNHNWVKMYDKASDVLRVETVINDARDFRVYRRGEGEDRRVPKRWMRLRKGIVDLPRRAEVSQRANARYLDGLAAVDDRTPLGRLLAPVCRPVHWKGRRARGLNGLNAADATLLETVSRGEFAINGFRNRDLRGHLFGATPRDAVAAKRQGAKVTRQLRLLRAHGLIKKISGTHRYHLTDKGRVIITALLTARAADTRRLAEAA